MKILAVVPARGGSKSIPLKNIAPLAGKPLISYTLTCAKSSSFIHRVVVSTDHHLIEKVSRSYGVEVIVRPDYMATDEASTHSVILHAVSTLALQGYCPDAVITLQPTSPLRTVNHIDDACSVFASDPSADSLVSCVYVPHIFTPCSIMRSDDNGYLYPYLTAPQPNRRQDKEIFFARNGAAIYITRTKKLSEYIYGGRLIPFLMDEYSSLDIDTPADLAEAERRLSEVCLITP
jgi:CMP-N,N'-diacetyllegionaminic acid synthase